MSLNPSQVVNNIKRSFNAYIADAVAPADVNFDQDPFDTESISSWYAVRYTGYSPEPTGMGDLIEDSSETRGKIHAVKCEVSAWCKNDSQRGALGSMADILMSSCEAASITLYDYADPEDPVASGTIGLYPSRGTFTPVWGGAGSVWKTSSDAQSGAGIVGFVMELELKTITEV